MIGLAFSTMLLVSAASASSAEAGAAIAKYQSCLLGLTLKFDDGIAAPADVAKKMIGCDQERAAALAARERAGEHGGLRSQADLAVDVIESGRQLRALAARQKSQAKAAGPR